MSTEGTGVVFTEGTFTNQHGVELYTVRYSPVGTVKAFLLFHHGYGEHIGRYDRVFRRIAAQGVSILSYDAQGHGKSGPKDPKDRAYVKQYTDLVEDLWLFRERVLDAQQPSPPLPVFVAGHSMGGMVAALATHRKQSAWAGLILHSALVDVEWTLVLRLQAPFGALLSTLVPRAAVVPAVRPEDMSPDPEVVAEYQRDPLNTLGPVKARTAHEMLKGFDALQRISPVQPLTLPLLAVHGDTDRTTSRAAVAKLVEQARSTDKTFEVVEGGYHELLFSPGWERLTDNVSEWILARTPQAQQPTEAAPHAAAQPRPML